MRRLVPVILLLLLVTALPCRGMAPEDALSELYGSLPEEVADRLPDGVEDNLRQGDGTAAAMTLDASFLFSFLGKAMAEALKEGMTPLLLLLGTVLLAALLHAFSDTAGEPAAQTVAFAAELAVLMAVLRVLKSAWALVTETVAGIGLLAKGALPAMTALSVASGSITASTVNATWVTALLTLTEQLGEAVLGPLFGVGFACLGVSLFSRLTGGSDLSGILGGIRQLFVWFLTVIGAVLSAIMTYQTVLTKSADTVLLRSIKLASGQLIPVVGGTLSETAGSYLSSLSLLRSSAGTLATVALLLLVLPPLLYLIVCRAGFGLATTVAALTGCPRAGDTVREASALLDLGLALVALLSVMLVILVGVFVTVAVAP